MDDLFTLCSELFLGNGIVIAIGCMIIGLFLKGTFKKLPNKYIPFINVAVSLVLGFAIPDTFNDKDIVSKMILLVFLGLSSVGLYEALCIMLKNRFDIDVQKIVDKFSNSQSSNEYTDGSVTHESEEGSSVNIDEGCEDEEDGE